MSGWSRVYLTYFPCKRSRVFLFPGGKTTWWLVYTELHWYHSGEAFQILLPFSRLLRLNSVLLQLPLNPSVSIHYHSAGKKHECLQEKNLVAICLLVYKMTGSPQSIKSGLIDFSVKLCMSRHFEMKMTTKRKMARWGKEQCPWQSQPRYRRRRTDRPTNIVCMRTPPHHERSGCNSETFPDC